MAKQPHRVWRIKVASCVEARELRAANGKGTPICDLPTVGTYLIEAKQCGVASKKALKLAVEDGISEPIVQGSEWMNPPWGSPKEHE